MISRRQFLKDAGLVVLGAAAGGLALNAGCKSANRTPPASVPDLSYLKYSDPATVDNQNLPVTPLNGLHFWGEPPPGFNTAEYRLSVYGLVDNPLELTLQDLQTFDRVTQKSLILCRDGVTDNPWWSGVLLSTILKEASVQTAALSVTFHSVSGTARNARIADSGVILLADKVDGVDLPQIHGYPLRVVHPRVKGSEWLKWVTSIEVKSQDL